MPTVLPILLPLALGARTAEAEDAAPKPNSGVGEGLAFDLSGGMGGVVDVGEAGGAMVALSWQRRGFGVGAFAAGVGASGNRDKEPAERDGALLLAAGGLLSWVGRDGQVVPFVGAGVGWSRLSVHEAGVLGVLEGNGPMVLARGGLFAPESGMFMDLRLDVPLFHAEHDTAPLRDWTLAVIAEGGFRFGN